jgi:hypothetical protein
MDMRGRCISFLHHHPRHEYDYFMNTTFITHHHILNTTPPSWMKITRAASVKTEVPSCAEDGSIHYKLTHRSPDRPPTACARTRAHTQMYLAYHPCDAPLPAGGEEAAAARLLACGAGLRPLVEAGAAPPDRVVAHLCREAVPRLPDLAPGSGPCLSVLCVLCVFARARVCSTKLLLPQRGRKRESPIRVITPKPSLSAPAHPATAQPTAIHSE